MNDSGSYLYIALWIDALALFYEHDHYYLRQYLTLITFGLFLTSFELAISTYKHTAYGSLIMYECVCVNETDFVTAK